MTDPTISIKGLIKLGFIDHGDEWIKDLVNDYFIHITIRDGEPCEGCITDGEWNALHFNSITYKQAKAIIEVFGTRF